MKKKLVIFLMFFIFNCSFIFSLTKNQVLEVNSKSGVFLDYYNGIDSYSYIESTIDNNDVVFNITFKPNLAKKTAQVIFATSDTLPSKENQGKGIWGISAYIANGLLNIGFSGNKNDVHVLRSVSLKEEWSTLTLIVDKKDFKVYLKGKEVYSGTINLGWVNITDKIIIGSSNIANTFYWGFIQEFDIYKNSSFNVDKRELYKDMPNNYFVELNDIDLSGEKSYKTIPNLFLNPEVKTLFIDFELKGNYNYYNITRNILNSTSGLPESMADWGYAINYDNRNGLVIYIKSKQGTYPVFTHKRLRSNVRYTVGLKMDKLYLDVYFNGKKIKQFEHYSDVNHSVINLLVGAGILKDSYARIKLNKLFVSNYAVDYMEFELLAKSEEIEIIDEYKNINIVVNPSVYLYSAISSYILSGISFALIPAFFSIHNYHLYYYNELYDLYSKSKIQQEADIYYDQMKYYSDISNAFLAAGIVMIPLSVVSFTTGFVFNILYHNNKISNNMNIGLELDPFAGKVGLSYRMEF